MPHESHTEPPSMVAWQALKPVAESSLQPVKVSLIATMDELYELRPMPQVVAFTPAAAASASVVLTGRVVLRARVVALLRGRVVLVRSGVLSSVVVGLVLLSKLLPVVPFRDTGALATAEAVAAVAEGPTLVVLALKIMVVARPVLTELVPLALALVAVAGAVVTAVPLVETRKDAADALAAEDALDALDAAAVVPVAAEPLDDNDEDDAVVGLADTLESTRVGPPGFEELWMADTSELRLAISAVLVMVLTGTKVELTSDTLDSTVAETELLMLLLLLAAAEEDTKLRVDEVAAAVDEALTTAAFVESLR